MPDHIQNANEEDLKRLRAMLRKVAGRDLEAVKRRLEQAAKPRPGAGEIRVLDIACGECREAEVLGDFVAELKGSPEATVKLTGIDVRAREIADAARKFGKRREARDERGKREFEFLTGDATKLGDHAELGEAFDSSSSATRTTGTVPGTGRKSSITPSPKSVTRGGSSSRVISTRNTPSPSRRSTSWAESSSTPSSTTRLVNSPLRANRSIATSRFSGENVETTRSPEGRLSRQGGDQRVGRGDSALVGAVHGRRAGHGTRFAGEEERRWTGAARARRSRGVLPGARFE